jgi:hypothetical protein
MNSMPGAPEKFPILHDDYHAKYTGRLADGSQFFLSSAFDPAIGGGVRREFVVLYLFNSNGALYDDRIDELGPLWEGVRGRVPVGNKLPANDVIDRTIEQRLAELGEFTFGDIEIRPFEIERFGLRFGFIAMAPEEEGEDWCVEFHPGNFMAFYPPWDGEYDT